jgi:exonuclease SbcC
MCYRDSTEVLDLTGVHLACLSGENGAGKSALLEAITWALWGRARDRSIDDELISKGAVEMEVDFEFILNGDAYRVIRKRAMKNKSGTTVLEIQIGEGEPGSEQWRTLSGATLKESQARLIDLLKIDYETFINSAFLMQGRADEFTTKSPADRKEVLAKILGLEQYERLENEAKEEAKQRAGTIAELSAAVKRIEVDLERRPDYDKRLGEVEDDLALQQAELTERRTELAEIRVREQKLVHTQERLREIAGHIERRERQMDVLKTRIVRNDERRKSLEQLLGRREEIERGWADLQALQERDGRLNDVRSSLDALDKDRIRLEGELNGERGRLDFQRGKHEESIRRLTQNLAGRGVVEQQLADVLDKLNKLARVQQQHEDTRCEKEALEVKLRTIVTERNNLEREGKNIRAKLDLLVEAHSQSEGHVGCPLCGTGLTEDALRRVRESYEREIEEKRQEFRKKDQEIDEVNKGIVAIEKQLAREQEELKPLEMYRKREAELKHKQFSLDQDEQELTKEESGLVLVKTRLADGDFSYETRKSLVTVQARIGRLEYDPEDHTEVRRRLAQLRAEGYDSQYHNLQLAEKELPSVREAMDEDNAELAVLRADQEADHEEELTLAPLGAELEEVRDLKQTKEREANALDDQVNGLLDERGQLKSKLAHCDQLQEEKEKHSAALEIASEEKGIYDELMMAFGKKGIQAMIIENIIPEVEEESNALLHRMTDGRMSVQLVTQKDAKSGKSVIETLDILIADEVGTRDYAMYSGGEAFRVNFAVRIALSKLLARRAGTQLQTLVIDEGFGSQDGQGREKLVGAIRSIQDDFEKILVITHIEELKDEFPTRINIVKTGSGSKIMAVEA